MKKFSAVNEAYRRELSLVGDAYLDAWSRRLRRAQSSDVEGALAEALSWWYLRSCFDEVKPADVPGQGGTDFRCSVSGITINIEVTTITRQAATNSTKMATAPPHRGQYALLTKSIRSKVRGKLNQVRPASESPTLVMVTTLHWNAARACMGKRGVEAAMTSGTSVTIDWDPHSGDSVGSAYTTTDLAQAVFLSPNLQVSSTGEHQVEAKYQPISGFLLGGFGLYPNPVSIFGGLNPNALKPIDPGCIPSIDFCSFSKWPAGTSLGLEWSSGVDP